MGTKHLYGALSRNRLAAVNTCLVTVLLLSTIHLRTQHDSAQHHEWILPAKTPIQASSSLHDSLHNNSTVPKVVAGTAPTTRQDKTTTPLVTFIIPTKGRDTLNQTLASLFNMTEQQSWRAIVVADGVGISAAADARVTVAKIPRTGSHNHAAQLRNFGMMRADTEWAAYVDDDDTLSATYLERLQEELETTPSADAVIFRMLHSSSGSSCVLPLPDQADFSKGYVGISFAMRRQLYLQGFRFVPGEFEDFQMLDTLRSTKRKW